MKFKELLKEALEPKDVEALIKNIQAQMEQLVQHVKSKDTEIAVMKKQQEDAEKARRLEQEKTEKEQAVAQKNQKGIGTTKEVGQQVGKTVAPQAVGVNPANK